MNIYEKILEKVIYARLYQHITQNNVSATEQYGFRNNSTKKASFKLINEILLALNNKLTVGLFCDLGKAFDSVNHDILLSKCEFYGFRGKTNALLRSYLSDRYQRVLINNSSFNNTTFSE
jgi:sarcosine oxidase/L-pipecolate oxidase